MPKKSMKLPARLPQRPPLADPAASSVSSGASVPGPLYSIRVRDNNLVPQGQLVGWTAGDIVLRMNDVGKWAFTVRADDALRSLFATRGAGIIVSVDLGDGFGSRTVMSGPVWLIERTGLDNFYTLGGPTDEWWLRARNCLPQGGRCYMEQILVDSPVRYLRLDETGGTTALDFSTTPLNGTYINAPTLSVTGAIPGDPDTAITLAAASLQRVSVPTVGISAPTFTLNTGNAPISFAILLKIAAAPASSQYVLDYGNPTRTNHQNMALFVDSAGKLNADVGGAALLTSAAALTTGVWHLAHLTWDSTNLRLFVDNVQVGTGATPGAQAIPVSPTLNIGSTTVPGNFFSGSVDEFVAFNAPLSAAQIAAENVAFTQTHGAYDTRSGTASTVIYAYVAANLVSPLNLDRQNARISSAIDTGLGTTVNANARGQNLLALCQQLASAGGDIGFKVTQTANGQLTFSCYQPNDRTANVKFSLDLRNLFDFQYGLGGPISNYTAVWGGGVGTGRAVVPVRDANSIANWGLCEGPILDARDTTDVRTMAGRGQADINANSEQTNLAITPGDVGTIRYLRDYNLGDIVAMTIDGNTITNKIRSVHIELKSPGDQERITPGIGNPSQGDVARWFDSYQARQQVLNRVQQQIQALGTQQ